MASLATEHRLPLIYDIGSGLIDAETPWISGPSPKWLRDEPAARQALEKGADLVTFSGDKLLGGPQAGIIVGNGDLVDRLRKNPLTRALRVDGVTLAGLGATLEAYADRDVGRLPFWRHSLLGAGEIETRAASLARELGGQTNSGVSEIGAGSVPGVTMPTTLVILEGEDDLYERLLDCDPAVLCRRESGSLVIDLRTVDPELDSHIVEAVRQCR